MKELILFDFDGVVIDNSQGIFNCIKYSLDKLGIPLPSEASLRRFVGPSLFDSFCRYIENDASKAELFVKHYRERYAPTGYKECELYNGIKEVLQRLKAEGFTLAVCSGKPYEFVKKITEHLNIAQLFSGLFCPGFATHSSNKAGYILEAASFFKVPKERVLMVGDTVFDIRSAKEAQVEAMGVLYGFSSPGELENEGADCIAQSPAQIYSLITGKKRCVIFGAGEYGTAAPQIKEGDFLIAADGGYSHCLAHGLTPELFIGDFDSADEKCVDFSGETIRLPREKDLTDSEASVKEALKRGYKSFAFYGCLGGRLDHTLANISLLKGLSQGGFPAVMYGSDCNITAVTDGTASLPSGEKGTVSVFSLSEQSEGVYIRGLKYPLENTLLKSTVSLGVSNEFTGKPAYIGVKKGTLLIISQNT